MAWKERVDNIISKATKLLQTAYGMSYFSKVFPSAIGRSLHYKRAVLREVHNFFQVDFLIRIQVYLDSDH